MAAVEREIDDKFANIDVDSILTRVGRRPLTFNKTRFLDKAPEFVKRLTGEEKVQEGTTIQLETQVSGFPRPILRWYKDAEEILDHPRIHVEGTDNGVFVFTIENVNKGDEACYRCRAENDEGVSSSMFYLSVKVKPKSPKRSKHLTRRTVSYPPMFPTIVEKVEEEEKAAKESARSPPSPLTQLYDGLTLQTRHTWPKFLGDWAYVENAHRNGGSIGSETDSETGDAHSIESIEHDDVFSEESCEKPSDGGHAEFYVSSDDTTPETPEVLNRRIQQGEVNNLSPASTNITNGIQTSSGHGNKKHNLVSGNSNVVSAMFVDAKSEDTPVKCESNNNETKHAKGKRDMHLPLSNGLVSGDKLKEKKEDKENVLLDKTVKRKKDKDSSVKKTEDKKKSGEKVKISKKTEDKDKSEKSVKKVEKEKTVKKSETKEKVEKKDNTGGKTSCSKDDTKLKHKPKDSTKSPTEKKTVKKIDSKDKKTDSPKRKSESKDKISKLDYISNPDPPILGSARPLVFTHMASRISTLCTGSRKDTTPLDGAEVYTKSGGQTAEVKQCKDLNGDVRCHGNMDLAIVAPPVGDVPFGRYFEEFIFVVCLFTFIALCTGIPIETFVLVILGMHFFYSMVTILGLC